MTPKEKKNKKLGDGSIVGKRFVRFVLLKMNVTEKQKTKKISRSSSDNFFYARTNNGFSKSNYYRVRK